MECILLIMMMSLGIICGQSQVAPETAKASQCFKSLGIPKVSFSCPPDHMIKINKAFHGIAVEDRKLLDKTQECRPSPGLESTNCTYCDGDCVDDSMNLVYDWSTCMGNSSCHRTVMQSFMPDCKVQDPFSDYLQVEYQCIQKSSVIDICSNLAQQWSTEGGYLMSPNYPDHYPTGQDCMCTLTTDPASKITLSFYDLLLETKKGRCRADWLMLRQNDQKHRHCGAIMTGTKNITSTGHSLQLQFHSDTNNNVTQTFQYFTRVLKGFWMYFSAVPQSSVSISCRVLTPDDQPVREIWLDDSDYDELINIKETDLERSNENAGDMDDESDVTGNDIDNMGDKMADKKIKDPRSKENDVMGKEKDSVAMENEIDYQAADAEGSGKSRASAASTLTFGHFILFLLKILHCQIN